MLEKHAATYTDLRIEVERETGYYDEVTTTYRLHGKRPETDIERDLRIAQNKAEDLARLEREEKEFLKLQKKFAGKYTITKKE